MDNQKILVQKYGGTSVSTPERRQMMIEHVRQARQAGWAVAIVVSAMGRRGEPYATDTLLDLLRREGGRVDPRDYDMAFVCGEVLSATLMSHLLKKGGIPAAGLTGAQAGFYTDDNHSEAEILGIDPARVHSLLAQGLVPVVAGCQGAARSTGDFTTLGRGGSDTSGVALGVALQAGKVEIFTDVEGVSRADPRVVPQAELLDHIHFDSMLEMARYGAGVVHPRAVRTGRDGKVPVAVRSTFSNQPGTLINFAPDVSPLVGLAAMGPLETLILKGDTIGAAARSDWEAHRLIMSLVDAASGALILGASTQKSHELAAVRAELGVEVEAKTDQSWVSLIGALDAIAGEPVAEGGRDLLVGSGIDVFYHEVCPRRVTYIIPSADQTRACQMLYNRYLKGK